MFVLYNLFGGSMEKIIFHIDVNNAFLSWTAIDLLNNGYGYEKDITVYYSCNCLHRSDFCAEG